MCTYIFAGRFQPFHNGHKQVFNKICRRLSSTDILVLAVVSPFESNDVWDELFLEASKEHHFADRNPWDVTVSLTAVSRIARSSHRADQIITTLLPRPEYGWQVIKSWFPQKRIWIIPDAGENFDNQKSEYFKKLGDEVIRIPDKTGVSGWELRDLYKKGQYNKFNDMVPDGIAEIYFKDKRDDNAENDFQKRAETFENHSRWVTSENINSVPRNFWENNNYVIGDVVDLGGGTGYLSSYLYQHLKNKTGEIVLVDISKNMLDEAIKKSYPLTVRNTSIETFCDYTTKKYDTILIRQVLHYVDNVEKVVYDLHNILNDNGIVYIGQIIVEDDECKEWHDELMLHISKNRKRTFTNKSFIDLFTKNGFKVIYQESSNFEERVTDLFERRVSDYIKTTIDSVIKNMREKATDSIKQKMHLRFEDDDLFYTVTFSHLFLKKQD